MSYRGMQIIEMICGTMVTKCYNRRIEWILLYNDGIIFPIHGIKWILLYNNSIILPIHGEVS